MRMFKVHSRVVLYTDIVIKKKTRSDDSRQYRNYYLKYRRACTMMNKRYAVIITAAMFTGIMAATAVAASTPAADETIGA